MKGKIIASVLVAGILLFASCDKSRVFEQNNAIEHSTWPQSMKFGYTVPLFDTAHYNIYVNVRNAGDYQYSNLFLFITMTFPDGKKSRDTVECTLADPAGKWLGEGLGDIYDVQMLFKERVKFPKTGTYHFEVEQAMRVDPLQGITDVGLRIEKSE